MQDPKQLTDSRIQLHYAIQLAAKHISIFENHET